MVAPAATPKPIVAKLHDMVQALKLPDIVERIESQGAEPIGNTPAQFAAFIAAESAKYARIARQAGVRSD